MKLIRTEDAAGQVLCHDITQIIPGEFKGARFKKGHIIQPEDIPVLLSIGKENLYVWEKKPGILHEDEAAALLYKAAAGQNIHGTEPREGKIELIADCDGLLKIDRRALLAVNSTPQMMIATIHGDLPVKKGAKLAGTRIIPLVIEQEKMEAMQAAAGPKPILNVLPFHQKKFAVITTGSEVFKGRIEDMHDSAQALRGKKLLLVGFTLFSMFFGAGNLIFPPFLGAQAGTALWLAFAGFAVSAIGLPIAGVAAVARAGGLPALAGRVHPRFAQVFAVLVYLSIGPCLAIPRTASTSFEMLTPLVGRSTPGQFIYSLVFFAAAYFVALKPEKLTQRLGRILCPALLVLIVVLFAGCILRPAAPGYGTPAEAYAALPAAQGVLDGYQTMDALAALNFGAVIALNLQAVGITEEAAVRRGTIRAGFIAGGMLLMVYAMLTHIGGISGAAFPGSGTGAAVLTALADGLFGRVGQVLLAAIFVIACFNTCVGLIASVGEYFHELLPRLPYPAIAAFFALVSMLLANIGLANILSLSVPVLNAIYPIAIVLIVVEFLPGRFQRTSVWRLSILFTAIQSIPAALPFGPLSTLMNALPLSSLGFGWLLPALIGIGAGLLM